MHEWLRRLDAYFPVRWWAWLACSVLWLLSTFTWVAFGVGGGLALVGLFLTLLGLRDARQKRHAVLRNYPVIGHLRFLLEFIRPEIRQYFIEADHEAAPFSRQQRSLVYQRAKSEGRDASGRVKLPRSAKRWPQSAGGVASMRVPVTSMRWHEPWKPMQLPVAVVVMVVIAV